MNAVNGTIFAADIPIFPKGAYSVKMYGRRTRNAVPVGESKVKPTAPPPMRLGNRTKSRVSTWEA